MKKYSLMDDHQQTEMTANVSVGTSQIVTYKPHKYLKFFPELFCPKYSFNELIIFALLDQKGSITCTNQQSKWYMKTLKKYDVKIKKKILGNKRSKLILTAASS